MRGTATFQLQLVCAIFSQLTYPVSAADSTSESLIYAPTGVSCPAAFTQNGSNIFAADSDASSFSTREATEISQVEKAWIEEKNSKTTPNLIKWFSQLDMEDYSSSDLESYIEGLDYDINIALAFSGGGFRAMLTGAGQLAALDNNTFYDPVDSDAPDTNKLAGLLDASAYMGALSGGSWLLSSLVFADWISVQDILDGDSQIWSLTESILNETSNITYFTDLIGLAAEKQEVDLNLNSSIVDAYGAYIGSVIFSDLPNNGLDLTWSGIRDMDSFTNYDMPFPIIITLGGNTANPAEYMNNPFEVTPFEFGSWISAVNSFSDIKYLGSAVDEEGEADSQCIAGLDRATFLLGCSSNIFPGLLYPNGSVIPVSSDDASEFATDIGYLTILIDASLNSEPYGLLPGNLADNKFSNIDDSSAGFSTGSDAGYVTNLVDGGLYGEEIPLDPFLQPSREVDVIFAFDSSSDSEEGWPNGNCLIMTDQRLKNTSSSIKFYDIPETTEEFLDLGLGMEPVFFGCNGSSLLSTQGDITRMTPIMIYIPNSDLTFASNTSTVQLNYDDADKYSMIKNGFNQMTRMNFTLDDEFAQCVGCAILRRSQERNGIEQGDQCARCFDRYCYDSGNTESYKDLPVAESLSAFETNYNSDYTYDPTIFGGSASVTASGTLASVASGTASAANAASSAAASASGSVAVAGSGSGSNSVSSSASTSASGSSSASSGSAGAASNVQSSSFLITFSVLMFYLF